MTINGHAKKGVSRIKQSYLVQPICLPCRGTIYAGKQSIGIASNDIVPVPSKSNSYSQMCYSHCYFPVMIDLTRKNVLCVGGYKGYGLTMMVEYFCSVLSGATITPNVRNWKDMLKPADLVCNIHHLTWIILRYSS